LLAKSPNSAGLILVAAVSGRALAQAARRAGYRVRVADFFADDDTMAAAEKVVRLPGSLRDGVDANRLVDALGELAGRDFALTEVVGGGDAAVRHPGSRNDIEAIRDPFRDVADYPERFRNGSRIAALCSVPSDFRDDARRGLQSEGGLEALILGSGFERTPGLVDELARHFSLAGNRGDAVRRVKDPEILASDCSKIGIKHPEFSWAAPADPENWISKRVGGAGGAHVQCVKAKTASADGYFQRRIDGQSISALFIAEGKRAHIVGFSRQWTSPTTAAPYRYGGAVRLRRFDRGDAAMIGGWLSGLTERAGLVGLCSADFIRNHDGYHLIEINPRPGSTLDIFDAVEAPLLQAHVSACRGEPFDLPRFGESMASSIAYTSNSIAHFPELAWPHWTADRQAAGSRLERGDPVCTVFARGPSASEARRGVRAKLRQVERAWGGGQP